MKYLLWALLAYLAYQFIFNLVIPVYKTSRRIKKSFREMHSRMQQDTYHSTRPATDFTQKNAARPTRDDYIEFEEVK